MTRETDENRDARIKFLGLEEKPLRKDDLSRPDGLGSLAVTVKKFGLATANEKAPTDAVISNIYEPEDEYQNLYIGASRDQGLIQPPYFMKTLDRLSQENNALQPAIEAMVTNIDGTGYRFENGDKDEEAAEDNTDDANIELLDDFFKEVWPGMSWLATRKQLRRDFERTGNAYLEVLRNPQDEIIFLRHVDAKMMRIVRLDDPVAVKQTVIRNGKPVTITVMTRERRFTQDVNGISLVYFKEFGASRDINKNTGLWLQQGSRLPANLRGSEIIHFVNVPDSHTPYGVPKWINQLPSILGSRRAEEFNLEFFEHGGIPPVLIMLQGGALSKQTKAALEQKTSGGATKLNRVQVLEVEPSGGTFEQQTLTKVTVERFGDVKTSDSMFEKYDERCEIRVRRAFRLPPIFVGAAQDYTFASAFASYTVAEAQVFKPERDEFDELISMKLIPKLGSLNSADPNADPTQPDAKQPMQPAQPDKQPAQPTPYTQSDNKPAFAKADNIIGKPLDDKTQGKPNPFAKPNPNAPPTKPGAPPPMANKPPKPQIPGQGPFAGYKMRSNPMSIKDPTMVLQGLQVAIETAVVNDADVLREINLACGTNVKVDSGLSDIKTNTNMGLNPDGSKPEPQMMIGPDGKPMPGQPGKPGQPGQFGQGAQALGLAKTTPSKNPSVSGNMKGPASPKGPGNPKIGASIKPLGKTPQRKSERDLEDLAHHGAVLAIKRDFTGLTQHMAEIALLDTAELRFVQSATRAHLAKLERPAGRLGVLGCSTPLIEAAARVRASKADVGPVFDTLFGDERIVPPTPSDFGDDDTRQNRNQGRAKILPGDASDSQVLKGQEKPPRNNDLAVVPAGPSPSTLIADPVPLTQPDTDAETTPRIDETMTMGGDKPVQQKVSPKTGKLAKMVELFGG